MARRMGVTSRRWAAASERTTTAAPPSVIPLELPAWTVPSLRNTGGSFCSFSAVTPSRACSSSRNVYSPFLRSFSGMPTFSASKRPRSRAASARFWLCAA